LLVFGDLRCRLGNVPIRSSIGEAMRAFLFTPLLALFVYQQSCDLASMAGARPEQVEQKVTKGIRPYFPNAQARVFPQRRTIVAISCAQNIGEPVVAQVAEYLRNSEQIAQLRHLRKWGSVIGAPSYKFLRLGFEHSLVELDVDTGAIRTLNTDEQYTSSYRQNCSTAPTAVVNNPLRTYSYIGVFEVRITDGGQTRTIRVLDSLGVYSPSDFESQRGFEVNARESLMRSQFREQHVTVLDVSLHHVEKLELPESLTSQLGTVQ
jgi:hypothetical protein